MRNNEMTYQCPRCASRVKDWNGDDPKCGFDENGNFLKHNWNCATLNALREMGGEETSCDNNYVKVVSRFDVGFGILTWYKHRGQTDDFRDGYFQPGTLHYARQLLGDVEPAIYDDWEQLGDEDDED
jgi:hypothetical protein